MGEGRLLGLSVTLTGTAPAIIRWSVSSTAIARACAREEQRPREAGSTCAVPEDETAAAWAKVAC
jgi:hypothetical protein